VTKLQNSQSCQNCQALIEKNYCASCGEKRYSEKDFSYKKLISHLFTSLTDVDGKLIKSFKMFLTKPGQLALDYFNGVKRNRINPFQVFLFSNIFYFFALSFITINTFNTPLKVHMEASNFFHQELASEMVSTEVVNKGRDFQQFEEKFNAQSTLFSKTLILLIVPIFAILMIPVYFRTRNATIKLLVFSTHFFGFILVVSIVLGAFAVSLLKLSQFLFNVNIGTYFNNEMSSSLLLLTSIVIYFFIGSKRAFKDTVMTSIFKSLYMCFALYFSLLVYRSLLFFIVFYSLT